jgi:ADP-ribose pyrophosphatase
MWNHSKKPENEVPSMELKEEMVSQETVYNGIIVNVRRDKARLIDGRITNREVVEHPGGVAVFAVDKDDNVIMVRQFRYPMGEVVLELPAGKLEPGEDPRDSGIRELGEETGLVPGAVHSLGVSYSSPGIFAEKIHLFYAEDLTQGPTHPDDGEFLEILRVPYEELMEKAASGEIKDGKTLACILKASLYRRN